MEEKIKKLEEHLNYIWSLIPNKPTYGEFNKVFPMKDNVEMLRNFEKENQWFGIARYDTESEGISIISMFASITDYLSDGWRMIFETAAMEDTPIEDQVIVSFKFLRLDEED